MDREDRDHFKTIAGALVAPEKDSQSKPEMETSNLVRDPAYCLNRATMMFSCYRKDEAHDPEIYISAVAAVLSEYPKEIIDFVTDPRTGLPSEQKFLPNVAEVRGSCDGATARMARRNKPRRVAVAYVPPPVKPGQITYAEFFKLVAEGKAKARPIGAFERGGYLGPTTK